MRPPAETHFKGGQRLKKRIDWHSGFAGALGLSFRKYRDVLEIQREVPITKEPLRIDFLLIKKKEEAAIDNAIGRTFRKYNLIEYKNPRDALNIDTVWKTIGYAGIYKGTSRTVNAIPAEELTVTIIRSSYPRELFRVWRSEGKNIENTAPGVYQIQGLVEFPFQIVVTRELLDDDFLAFRIMKRNAEETDIVNFLELTNDYEEPGDREDLGAVLYVTKAVNIAALSGRREDDMGYSVVREVFKEEIEHDIETVAEEREKRGERLGERIGREKEKDSLKKEAKKLEQSGLGADQILKELGLI